MGLIRHCRRCKDRFANVDTGLCWKCERADNERTAAAERRRKRKRMEDWERHREAADF